MSSEPTRLPSTTPELAIRVGDLSKCFEIYASPGHRLRQFIVPRLRRLFGLAPRRYYKEFWALRDVSFEVSKGQTVGIIGRNGSGKSTLLQMICGTLQPTTGSIEVQGRVAALLELGSGFNPEFTGRENVYFNAGVLGQSEADTRTKFAQIEAFADIGEFIDQPVKTYSSGMMVRLAFAVIAHVDADILVIDEALAVGDAFFTQKCMRFLRDFMKTRTVLFVSHDLGAIKNLCSRAVWIDRGAMRYSGDARTACDLYLEELFGHADTAAAAENENKRAPREAADPATVLTTPSSLALPIPFAAKDFRAELFDRSTLRNDLKVFDFDPQANGFHSGKATIENVRLCNPQGKSLAYIVGGETVALEIRVRSSAHIQSPIVGFYVKDRLGQNLFGDNTWLSHGHLALELEAGQWLLARFVFDMPRLMVGDYAITIAFAEGTQQAFVQHHWIHDALQFTSQTSSVAGGLIGLPMQHIGMEIGTPIAAAGASAEQPA